MQHYYSERQEQVLEESKAWKIDDPRIDKVKELLEMEGKDINAELPKYLKFMGINPPKRPTSSTIQVTAEELNLLPSGKFKMSEFNRHCRAIFAMKNPLTMEQAKRNAETVCFESYARHQIELLIVQGLAQWDKLADGRDSIDFFHIAEPQN